MPYDTTSLGAGISRTLEAYAAQKEEQKQRARKFKALQQYAAASGYADMDVTGPMGLEELDAYVAGKKTEELRKQQQAVEARQQAQLKLEQDRYGLAKLESDRLAGREPGLRAYQDAQTAALKAARVDDAAMGAALAEFARTNERGVGDLPAGLGQSPLMQGLAGAAGPTPALTIPQRADRMLATYSAAGGGGGRGRDVLKDWIGLQPKPATGLPIGQSVPVYGQVTPPMRDAPLLGYTIGTGDGVTFRPQPSAAAQRTAQMNADAALKHAEVAERESKRRLALAEAEDKLPLGAVSDKQLFERLSKQRDALEAALNNPLALPSNLPALQRKLQAKEVEINALLESSRKPKAPAPAAAAPAGERKAMGGYVIGKRYQGLKYLGGDINNEANWER